MSERPGPSIQEIEMGRPERPAGELLDAESKQVLEEEAIILERAAASKSRRRRFWVGALTFVFCMTLPITKVKANDVGGVLINWGINKGRTAEDHSKRKSQLEKTHQEQQTEAENNYRLNEQREEADCWESFRKQHTSWADREVQTLDQEQAKKTQALEKEKNQKKREALSAKLRAEFTGLKKQFSEADSRKIDSMETYFAEIFKGPSIGGESEKFQLFLNKIQELLPELSADKEFQNWVIEWQKRLGDFDLASLDALQSLTQRQEQEDDDLAQQKAQSEAQTDQQAIGDLLRGALGR